MENNTESDICEEITHYVFTCEGANVEYNKCIRTYNEMVLLIRGFFKLKMEAKVRVYYIDFQKIEISGQQDFLEMIRYHRTIPNSGEIKILLIEEKELAFSMLLTSLTKNNSSALEESVVEIEKTVKKESADRCRCSEYLDLNQKYLELKNQIDMLRTSLKESNDMTKLSLENITRLVQMKNERTATVCSCSRRNFELYITQEVQFQIDSSQDPDSCKPIFDYPGIKTTSSSNENITSTPIGKTKFILCSLCNTHLAKFTCLICDDLFICPECQATQRHDYHPLCTLNFNHFIKENLLQIHLQSAQLANKLPSSFKKIFYNPKCGTIKLQINSLIPTSIEVKANTHLFFPFEIYNDSSRPISKDDLMITVKNSKYFKVQNEVIADDIQSHSKISGNILLIAPEVNGVYNIDMVCYHSFKFVNCPPISLEITVLHGLELVQNQNQNQKKK